MRPRPSNTLGLNSLEIFRTVWIIVSTSPSSDWVFSERAPWLVVPTGLLQAHDDGDVYPTEQIAQIIIHLAQLGIALLQGIVHRGQLFVSRLQLFFSGLELLIGALQLLVNHHPRRRTPRQVLLGKNTHLPNRPTDLIPPIHLHKKPPQPLRRHIQRHILNINPRPRPSLGGLAIFSARCVRRRLRSRSGTGRTRWGRFGSFSSHTLLHEAVRTLETRPPLASHASRRQPYPSRSLVGFVANCYFFRDVLQL